MNGIDRATGLLRPVWDEAPDLWLDEHRIAGLCGLSRPEMRKALELLEWADLVDRFEGRWLFPSH
jgi:DNA-binding GntR family transcriptional regulator